MRTLRSARGTALLEAAFTIPILLLVAVGIFEFGRAYQTWQVLTNAAREGTRVAVLPNTTVDTVRSRVRDYMSDGQLPYADVNMVDVDRNATIAINGNPVSASRVTINYPFQFIVLRPVARLVDANSQAGGSLVMRATALMRNESQ